MDMDLRQSLIELKDIALNNSETEIPLWVRETFVENLNNVLEKDASKANVKKMLIGGYRAIYDSVNPPEDDPVIVHIGFIVHKL